MIILKYVIVAVISYLLGSINFSIILSRKMQKEDVREHGSGNAGSTNMLRSYGKKMAILTILGDMIKVAVAILIAIVVFNGFPGIKDTFSFSNEIIILKSFAGLFCVIGHIFPCFFGLKGGKGVATSGGMVFMIDWRIALILLAIFFIVIIISKWVSLGSLFMALFYPVFMYLFHHSVLITIIASVFAIIVFIAHRKNIKNICNSTETKISFGHKENGTEDK